MDSVDKFVEDCIRREILFSYERRELLMLDSLLERVKFSWWQNKVVKRVGFQFKKVEGGRHKLMERADVAAACCKYLRIAFANTNLDNPTARSVPG